MTLPPVRLVLTGATFLLMCGGGMIALERMQRAAAVAERTKSALGSYRRRSPVRRGWLRMVLDRLLPATLVIAELFGIQVKRMADYPVRWWVILPGTLGTACGLSWMIRLVVDLPVLAAIPLLWLLISRFVFASFAARRRDLLYTQFPDALAMVVRSLRVGQTVTQALRSVARDAQYPTNAEFDRLADRLAIGVSLSEALLEMGQDSGLPEYRFFATTLLLQSQTGGSLTEALEGLADVIRSRVGLRRRAYALASEARTSAIILGIMPIITGIMLVFFDPSYARLLIDTPVGNKVLATAIIMLLVGAFVMHSMIRKIMR